MARLLRLFRHLSVNNIFILSIGPRWQRRTLFILSLGPTFCFYCTHGRSQKILKEGIASSFSFLSPSLFPFLSLPSLSFSLPIHSLLIQLAARGLGEHCKLPRWVQAQPGRQTLFCAIFSANQRILHARTDAVFIFSFSSFILLSSKFHTVLYDCTSTVTSKERFIPMIPLATPVVTGKSRHFK